MEEVTFAAKYGNWISIKKMTIEEGTRPEEVVALLSAIDGTVAKKSFEFIGIDTVVIDAYASRLVGGRRKGFGAVSEIFSGLKQSEAREELVKAIKAGVAPLPVKEGEAPAAPEAKMAFAEAYLVRSVLSLLGYSAGVDLEALQKLYPNIKVPKPRGRMPKK